MKDVKQNRIIFMGTPDFAVESLRQLTERGYNIVAVVTSPDRATGKHHSILQPSPVKRYALSRNLPLLQPSSLKDAAFLDDLRLLRPDLQIVVAFRLLPQSVWTLPPLGTFNLHASLLPQYRGAAPINHAIINGETTTGVTTFFLDNGVDLGRIILRKQVPIADTDTAGILHDELMKTGASIVCETVDRILSGSASTVSQDTLHAAGDKLFPAPKIFTETCRIDLSLPLKRIYDHIRGLSPTPAAWTELHLPSGTRHILKVYGAEKVYASHDYPFGALLIGEGRGLDIAVDGGFLRLQDIQLSGKKRMSASEFLNGQKNLLGARVE